MDLSTLEAILESHETVIKAMLSSLSENIKPEDARKALDQHIARTNRIVRNALPVLTPFKDPLVYLENMARSHNTASQSSPVQSVTPSKTTPLKAGFKKAPGLFSPSRKRSSPNHDYVTESEGSSPETVLDRVEKKKRRNVSHESRQIPPSHNRRFSATPTKTVRGVPVNQDFDEEE